MRLPALCARLSSTNDGAQAQLCIHIFMDSRGAVAISSALQINPYAAVAVNAIMTVVNVLNFVHHLCFFGIIITLSVFQIIVICIWVYPHPLQQPAGAKFLLMLFDETVSL